MPRIKKNKQIKEKLLQKGIELLSEHGYHGTGLKMILDAVDVPKGSFYNYFESKEQFAAAIIQAYSSRLKKRLDDFLEKNDQDPVSIIRTIHASMIQELEKQGIQKGCLLGNLAGEIGGMSPVCETAMKQALYEWKERFVQLLVQAQDQGRFRNDIQADELAEIVWSQWQGGLLKIKIEGNTRQAKASMDILLDQLLK